MIAHEIGHKWAFFSLDYLIVLRNFWQRQTSQPWSRPRRRNNIVWLPNVGEFFNGSWFICHKCNGQQLSLLQLLKDRLKENCFESRVITCSRFGNYLWTRDDVSLFWSSKMSGKCSNTRSKYWLGSSCCSRPIIWCQRSVQTTFREKCLLQSGKHTDTQMSRKKSFLTAEAFKDKWPISSQGRVSRFFID